MEEVTAIEYIYFATHLQQKEENWKLCVKLLDDFCYKNV